MRELKTTDIFKMSKIVKKMGLKISDLGLTEKTTDKEAGISLILKAFENLHMAEIEVNEFFASVSEMTVEEFENLPITKTIEIIKEFKNISGIESFLSQAVQ